MATVRLEHGADFSEQNVGFVGSHLPYLEGACEWAGAFGTGWEMPFARGYDYSLRNRPAVVVGEPTLENAWAQVNTGNYLDLPIGDTSLLAAGTAGQLTLVAVKSGVPSTGTADLISTRGTSIQNGYGLRLAASAGTLSFFSDVGAEAQSTVSLTGGASQTGAEFVAGAVNGLAVTLWRRGASDGAMVKGTGTLTTSTVAGRGVGFRVGDAYSGTNPMIRMGIVGIYNRLLTDAEIAAVYAAAKARMATVGITI
jgi:hypothetical protein